MRAAQSCPTLCDPVDYIVHGILQARILEWVAFPFSRGIFPTQGSNLDLPHCGWIFLPAEPQGKPKNIGVVASPFFSGSSRPRNRTWLSCIEGDSLPTELPGKPIISNNYSLQINKGFALRFSFVIQNTLQRRYVKTCLLNKVLIVSLDCIQDERFFLMQLIKKN